jgi:hypothetical protein
VKREVKVTDGHQILYSSIGIIEAGAHRAKNLIARKAHFHHIGD